MENISVKLGFHNAWKQPNVHISKIADFLSKYFTLTDLSMCFTLTAQYAISHMFQRPKKLNN